MKTNIRLTFFEIFGIATFATIVGFLSHIILLWIYSFDHYLGLIASLVFAIGGGVSLHRAGFVLYKLGAYIGVFLAGLVIFLWLISVAIHGGL